MEFSNILIIEKSYLIQKFRNHIRQSLASAIKNHFNKADVIAGVATAGIPHGVLVAEELGLPFIYVRNDYKGHGRKK